MRAMMRVVMRMPSPSQVEHERLTLRCDRGSQIARRLGFLEATSDTLA
jgi:hypothetical protein